MAYLISGRYESLYNHLNTLLDMKPNCYECQYRTSIPGDAHSACNHPSIAKGNRLHVAIHCLAGDSPTARELNIKGDAHGISSGWFFWPLNFDPVWLESCSGFVKKT
jgi:hypothetical protein